ncbi:hypothetical protein BC835DRAFT_1311206 [Cytidiella melzeri]|nr:hypothetical protein BC835DRAFT_1311206 [Cytidiella melzeri]
MNVPALDIANQWAPSYQTYYVPPPRFRQESHHFDQIFLEEAAQRRFYQVPNISTAIPSLFSCYEPVNPEPNQLPVPKFTNVNTGVKIVSPKPTYPYSPLRYIESALDHFDPQSCSTPALDISAAHFGDQNRLEGVAGHMGIVEHGPRLRLHSSYYDATRYAPSTDSIISPATEIHAIEAHIKQDFAHRQQEMEMTPTLVVPSVRVAEEIELEENEYERDDYRRSVWELLGELFDELTNAIDAI